MNRIKEILSCVFAEFFTGLFWEYILTGIGGLIFGVLGSFGLNGSGTDQEVLAFGFMGVVAGLFIFIGVIKTLLNKEHNRKLIALLDHVLFFIIMNLITRMLVPMVIVLVLLGIAAIFLRSAGNAPSQPSTPEEPQKEVHVWRENGMMRENLKVNSTGDMYYDPDDGEWHKISQ